MTAEIATPVDADPSSLVDRASESLFGPAGRFAVLNVDRYSEDDPNATDEFALSNKGAAH